MPETLPAARGATRARAWSLLDLQETRVPHLVVLQDESWALVRIRKGAKRALEGPPPL